MKRSSTVSWIVSFVASLVEEDITEQNKEVVASSFNLARDNFQRIRVNKQLSQRRLDRINEEVLTKEQKHQEESKDDFYFQDSNDKEDVDKDEFEHDEADHDNRDLSPINILCIDGGGARGWCIPPIYKALEESLSCGEENKDLEGEPLSNVFDLIGGTSAGGVGAMMIHKYPEYGVAAEKGKHIVLSLLERSFNAQRSWTNILSTGHYFNDNRGKTFQEFFGADTSLHQNQDPSSSDSNKRRVGPKTFVVAAEKLDAPSVAPAGSVSSGAQPSLLRSVLSPSFLEASLLRTYDKPTSHSGIQPARGSSSILMWEAVEASSAAPVVWGRTHAKRKSVDESTLSLPSLSSSMSSLSSCDDSDADFGHHDDDSIDLKEDLKNDADDSGSSSGGIGGKNIFYAADGSLVANNPLRHALQEAALLFPGRPLGVVISIGLGRHCKLGCKVEDSDYDDDDVYDDIDNIKTKNKRTNITADDPMCNEAARTVKEAGGQFVRLNPIIDRSMGYLTTDPKVLKKAQEDVQLYMSKSSSAKRAKTILRQCFRKDPSIRGRYVPATPAKVSFQGARKDVTTDSKVDKASLTNSDSDFSFLGSKSAASKVFLALAASTAAISYCCYDRNNKSTGVDNIVVSWATSLFGTAR